ncbi:MAG: MFS transporter [Candidatus Heimdallarchaeota archaeon]|nr:MFS transporter [Candidatus Heimdallarchaeota archaeon]
MIDLLKKAVITISEEISKPIKEIFEDNILDDEKKSPPSHEEKAKNKKSLFAAISITNSTGESFFSTFFPPFAALAGLTGTLLGIITSIRNLLGSILQGLFGRLSDKRGRKYFLLAGFLGNFIVIVLLLFYSNPIMLIIVSIVQAVSISIITPVWNASLGDITKIKERGFFIGKISALGLVISVGLQLVITIIFYLADTVLKEKIILGWIINIPEEIQYKIIFGIAAINYLLCCFLTLGLKETKTVNYEYKIPHILESFKDRSFRKFLVINSLNGLMMSLSWPLYPLSQVKILEMGFWEISIYFASFTVFIGLGQLIGGKISNRVGCKKLIAIGRISLFIFGPLWILAIFYDSWWLLLIEGVITGFPVGLAFVGINTYVLNIAHKDMRGTYTGLMQFFWGITTFIGSLIAGIISDALTNNFGLKNMAYIMFGVIAGIRLIFSLGYLLIDDDPTKPIKTKNLD